MTGAVRRSLIALATLLCVALPAVGVPAKAWTGHIASTARGSLTVFAAASLKDAFTTIGAQFGARTGARVIFSFGGSDTLATQIVEGAPADVFASANMAQMTVVANKGLIASKPAVFARNRLVVIVPKDNPARVFRLPDLGRPGLKLVLAAPSVPVGKYARASFHLMANDPAFGPHFLQRVDANVVSNETNVEAVVSKVALGEADAGVVYVSDLTTRDAAQVRSIVIPARFNQVATYPIAVVKGSHNAVLARQFVAYVLSSAGRTVLRKDGFITRDVDPTR